MVIINSIGEKESENTLDSYKRGSPFVYLVDHEQEMILILKRDLNEIVDHNVTCGHSSIQEFVTRKVQSLLERISDNGPLSLREIEMLNYAAIGKSNKQIAEITGRSESTIKNHFSSTMRKLNANDRAHAVTIALCFGWLSPPKISNILMNEKAAVAASEY